jgi:hypothetical protein
MPRHKISYLTTSIHAQAQIFLPHYEYSYPGKNFLTSLRVFIPWHKFSYLTMNIHAQVQMLLPCNEYSYPGTHFLTQVQISNPRYTVSYPCNKYHTHVQIFILMYKFSYPCTNFQTHVQIFIPMYKFSYPCTNFQTHVQMFIPMYKFLYPDTKPHTTFPKTGKSPFPEPEVRRGSAAWRWRRWAPSRKTTRRVRSDPAGNLMTRARCIRQGEYPVWPTSQDFRKSFTLRSWPNV